MTSAQDYLFKYSKWLIFVLAYLFLGYKLVTFDGYEALLEHFSSVSLHDYLFLFFVFLLLPLNLLFEALKWQNYRDWEFSDNQRIAVSIMVQVCEDELGRMSR